jgi:hypothetical protein
LIDLTRQPFHVCAARGALQLRLHLLQAVFDDLFHLAPDVYGHQPAGLSGRGSADSNCLRQNSA